MLDMNEVKGLWESLKPGDGIHGLALGDYDYYATVLATDVKGGFIFSEIHFEPNGVPMAGSPFYWDKEKKIIVDVGGRKSEYFNTKFIIVRGYGKEATARYCDRRKGLVLLNNQEYAKLWQENLEEIVKVFETLNDQKMRSKPEKMSAILNLVFGYGSFSDEQLIAMCSLLEFYEIQMDVMEKMRGLGEIFGTPRSSNGQHRVHIVLNKPKQ